MLASMAEKRRRGVGRGCRSAPTVSICLLLSLVPAHSLLPAPQELDASLDQALEALESGDSATAEKAFRRLLLDDPDRFEALLGWARSLAAQGRGAEALASLQQGAERRMAAGVYGEAVELLELAVVLDPESPGTKARLGRALILHRRYLAAEAPLRQALAQGGREPQWLLHLAGVLWEKGDLDEAEELYQEAVERARASSVTWHQLGRFLLWQGRYAESAEALRQAKLLGAEGFALELDRARALEGRAKSMGSKGEGETQRLEVLQGAFQAFQLAVKQAPEHSGARYGLARVLGRLGDGEEAQRQLENYRRLHREDQGRIRRTGLAKARLDRAYDLLRQDRPREAVEILETLPVTVEVLRALALAHREDDDP